VAARIDAPVLGAPDTAVDSVAAPKWEAALSYRYQYSDRHFVGREEQHQRQDENSQVTNNINVVDLSLRYNLDRRTSVSLSIPYLEASRTSGLRAGDRVVDRVSVRSNGVGDVVLGGSRLLLDPSKPRRGNVSLSLGIKAPTGEDGATDTRVRLVNGQRVGTVESVDQSIQPGDGGWGAVVGVSGYRLLDTAGTVAAYGAGSYLINPEGTNGVRTFRSRPSEAIMSIADQYVVRTGVQATPKAWRGLGAGLGGRIEGVPPHDLFGSSEGFRRPGYAISVEPSLSYTRDRYAVSLAVPVAVERNRQRSVSDIQVGGHGDAAFADYVVLLGYFVKF
jgi:hypothetical protein